MYDIAISGVQDEIFIIRLSCLLACFCCALLVYNLLCLLLYCCFNHDSHFTGGIPLISQSSVTAPIQVLIQSVVMIRATDVDAMNGDANGFV
jgi:hypothetical protein